MADEKQMSGCHGLPFAIDIPDTQAEHLFRWGIENYPF